MDFVPLVLAETNQIDQIRLNIKYGSNYYNYKNYA